MNVESSLKSHISTLFDPLRNAPADDFPGTGALSNALALFVAPAQKTKITVNLPPHIVSMFSTAAINMWLRAVHSFLISSALSKVSPIWASVSGYYSSHYSVRAIAHTLGYFQLFKMHKTVQLEFRGTRAVGTFNHKTGKDREHQIYWKVVKESAQFAPDPFFTLNNSGPDPSDPSDVAHRDKANYADHLPQLPVFNPLQRDEIISQIRKISSIRLDTAPIPSAQGYPAVESVQIMAYHRFVRFRELLDESLGGKNRFWNVHRNPPWARGFLDYQLTTSGTALEDLATQ